MLTLDIKIKVMAYKEPELLQRVEGGEEGGRENLFLVKLSICFLTWLHMVF